MKWLTVTRTGATKRAIYKLLSMAIPIESSIRFLIAIITAVLCSAALPTTATTITPIKTQVSPNADAAASTEPTSISLTHAISAVTPREIAPTVSRNCSNLLIQKRSVCSIHS